MHTYMATPYHKNPNPDGYEINNNITIYLICLIHAPVYTRNIAFSPYSHTLA